ncbi:MAG: hypothetical protein M1828_002302 [Chrysothrix sp. TS-e1954]|nr:MAG: hypothetical protein M1828_002302 [Chrysothrix sp. TS-e1954]
MPHDEARARAMRSVQAIFDRYQKIAAKQPKVDGLPQLYDYDCMSRAKLLDAGPEGSVLFEFTIDRRYSNMNDVMHGGAAAVLFDMFTTTALGPVAKPGYWYFMGGVTRALNITYCRAVPVGTTVLFRSWVVQHGKTQALIRGEMTTRDGKKVYATVEHHKVHAPVLPHHIKERIPWDDEMEHDARAAEEDSHTPVSKL